MGHLVWALAVAVTDANASYLYQGPHIQRTGCSPNFLITLLAQHFAIIQDGAETSSCTPNTVCMASIIDSRMIRTSNNTSNNSYIIRKTNNGRL